MIFIFIISACIALIAFTIYIFKRDKWTLRIFVKTFFVVGLVILSFSLLYFALPNIFNINSFPEALSLGYENTFKMDIPDTLKSNSFLGTTIVLLHKSFTLLITIFAISIIKEKIVGLYKSK
jgi:hypothetical protein